MNDYTFLNDLEVTAFLTDNYPNISKDAHEKMKKILVEFMDYQDKPITAPNIQDGEITKYRYQEEK